MRRAIVTLVAVTLAALVCALRPIGSADLPAAAGAVDFVDRSGLPLGTILGRDERHTMAVPLDRISPAFVQAILTVEDARFYQHGALDETGALRALWTAVVSRRLPSGASTIDMQLARQLEPVPPGPLGQLQELWIAQRLENGLSKRRILEAYCNRIPMGSNVYGVEAASRTYFGTPAAQLDLAQAALLAGLPNDPTQLDPYAHFREAKARQALVLRRMRAQGAIDAGAERRALEETLTLAPRAGGIVAAPHFLFREAARTAPERTRVTTTLDRGLQEFVQAQVRDVVASLRDRSVSDAAAIVIDNASGDVLAYAGSPDYFDDAALGRNDGVQALRQPGSALKPFLYERALEAGTLHPNTILADVPTTYAIPGARTYRPADYSNRFAGPVRVRVALADSLNVPAVRVLARLGVDDFLGRLHALGFTHLNRRADYYGLGLTLGGGEVSLYELARAYAVMARRGTPLELRTSADDPPNTAPRAHGAAWDLVTDFLSDPHARAASFGVDSILDTPFPSAVKTGTSSDFRDTWTAGFTRDYTVAVWVGNFDGSPMQHISGVSGAGPLWSRIMLHLHELRDPQPFDEPHGYARTPMCADTGAAPRPGCTVVMEWLAPADMVQRTDSPERSATYDTWLVTQEAARRHAALRVLFPRDGDVFVDFPHSGRAQAVKFEFAGDTIGASVSLDGKPLAAQGADYLWALRLGAHTVTVRSATAVASARFLVEPPPPASHRVGFSFGPRSVR